jgi:hypothetical protein
LKWVVPVGSPHLLQLTVMPVGLQLVLLGGLLEQLLWKLAVRLLIQL